MKFLRFGVALICTGLVPPAAHAFGVRTHEEMNKSAVTSPAPDGFLLANFLTEQLGLAGDRHFAGLEARDWIRLGGKLEDDWTPVPDYPIGRFYRHFHDPLRSWNDAGLLPASGTVFEATFERQASSIVWMQWDDGVDAGADSAGQGWSWPDARRAYLHALTTATPQDRDQKWADTFRAVGQIMHLVEDAAVPEHTRNDAHPLGHFERWHDKNIGSFNLDPAAADPRFDRSILYQPMPNPYAGAPVPIARLIDSDTYNGDNVNATVGREIGLAEFTNANFFSEDTVPDPEATPLRPYKHPDVTQVQPSDLPSTAAAFDYRRHYYKKGDDDGIQVDPAMVVRVYDKLIVQNGTVGISEVLVDRTTDRKVWAATAAKVVPKAVDYAQGALEYFFRGRLAISEVSDTSSQGNYSQVTLTVQNDTHWYDPGGAVHDELTDGAGDAWAVLRYRTAAEAPYAYAVSTSPQSIDLGSPQEVAFGFTNGLPAGATDIDVTVVWRGRLGFEEGAILVGTRHLNCRAVHLDGTQFLYSNWLPDNSPRLTMSMWLLFSADWAYNYILNTLDDYSYYREAISISCGEMIENMQFDSYWVFVNSTCGDIYCYGDFYGDSWASGVMMPPEMAPRWYHVLMSLDLDRDVAQFAVDDVVSFDPFSNRLGGYIGWQNGPQTDLWPSFGLFSGPAIYFWGDLQSYMGDVAEVWLEPDLFLDLTLVANRRKFIDENGKPVDLGARGERPTGSPPAVYLSGGKHDFPLNRGAGGPLFLSGVLTDAETSPCNPGQ